MPDLIRHPVFLFWIPAFAGMTKQRQAAGNGPKGIQALMGDRETSLAQFSRHFKEINDELKGSLDTRVALVEDIAEYSLLGKGKRVRPLLFVLCAQLCGSKQDNLYHFSTIFEYLHTASLLHDDVLDNADTRRKKPSARQVWGNPAAILGGDFLYSKASAIAVEWNSLQALRVLTAMVSRMVEGQLLELSQTHNWHINKDQYLEIITAKTAVLMSAACSCGAIVAGADQETLERMSDYGLNLGVAFQLIDDMLDYTSCEEAFGKPVGKDLREGKVTLPLIYAISKLESKEVDRLEALFKSEKVSDEDYTRLIAMVRQLGVIQKVKDEAAEYTQKAVGLLDPFPPSPAKEELIALCSYLVDRDF
jgi:octaprenyl-diphosphate synthase